MSSSNKYRTSSLVAGSAASNAFAVTSRLARYCVAFVALSALLCVTATSHASDKANKQQLQAVKKSIAELKAELEKTKSSREKMLKNLEDTEKEIIDLRNKSESLKGQIKESETELNSLREERGELQQKKKSQQQQVNQHLRAAYRMGQQSNIKLLLNQQDPATIARNMRYHGYIVEARAEKIEQYTGVIDRLETIEQDVAYQTEKLKSNHQKLRQKQESLRARQSDRKETITSLSRSLTNQSDKLSSMEQDRKRLFRLLEQVSGVLDASDLASNAAQLPTLKGKLPWPTKGRVQHNFGSTRAGAVRWQGLMISANTGAPVKSIHYGRVIFSDYLRGQGLLIIVDHGKGYLSLYAHNASLHKSLGDWVSAGETIAKVGNTGGQKESALYFELRHNGKPQNPRKWLGRG